MVSRDPILWVHRITERTFPKCKNVTRAGGRAACIFVNPETSVNHKNTSGKIKLCPPLASANVSHASPQESFLAKTTTFE